jgi:hypothetical protein
MQKNTFLIALLVSLLGFAFSGKNATAQDFSVYNTSLPGIAQGASAWGDYDRDGYLDLVLTGMNTASQPITRLYRNNAGTFQEINAGLMQLKNGTVQFGDYNNDGYPDILLCGQDNTYSAYTFIYKNNGNGTFTKMSHGLSGVYNGMALFADYNNDGFLDVLVTGDTLSYSPVTRLFRNNGDDTFTRMDFGFEPALSSSASFGDYDNDGDLDFLLSGDIGGAYYTKLYRNDNGVFAEVPLQLEGVGAGWSVFFDFDKDGDNDILLMGNDLSLTPTFKIYRNMGENVFQEVFAGVSGLALGNIDIADYDNDGFPDFVATGRAPGCGTIATVLFRNNQAGSFWQAASSFINLSYSHASWADFDNDGDSDLLLLGASSTGMPTTRLYRNDLISGGFTPHTVPPAPGGLTTTVEGEDVILMWSPPAAKPAGSAFSYNVRVGIASGSSEIMAPASDPTNGYVRLPGMGNATQDTFWILRGLRESAYYWSVQVVDASFGGSVFAPEETFTISLTGIGTELPGGLKIYPNPCKESLHIANLPARAFYTLCTLQGRELMSGQAGPEDTIIHLNGLKPGFYLLNIRINGMTGVHKILVQ